MPTTSAIDVIVDQQEKKTDPVTSRRIREVLSDAYAFIRSAEANAALATVTLEELIGDQINRNGDSDRSNASQYNPYSFQANKDSPEGIAPTDRANFLGAADTQRPTKLDQIRAIQDELSSVIEEVKNTPPVDVAPPEEHTEASELSIPETEA